MDSGCHSRLNEEVVDPLLDALNEQVVPQLAHLQKGLAVATYEVLRAAIDRGQPVTGTVLQVRVELDGHLFTVAVSVVVSP